MRVISSPSGSTTGFATLIFPIAVSLASAARYCRGPTIKAAVPSGKLTGRAVRSPLVAPLPPANRCKTPGY